MARLSRRVEDGGDRDAGKLSRADRPVAALSPQSPARADERERLGRRSPLTGIRLEVRYPLGVLVERSM